MTAQEVSAHVEAGEMPSDTVLLDFIASEYLDVSAFAMPTGGDDADVGWKLHQEHMGAKGRVEVACHYRDDLRAAIREAMQVLGYSVPAVGEAGEMPGDLSQKQEAFCDTHCCWSGHHPDCALATWEKSAPKGEAGEMEAAKGDERG